MLILFELDIGYFDFVAVVVDRPAVTGDTIDAIGVGETIVDIHHEHRVIGIDIDMVDIIGRLIELIAVDSTDETHAFWSLFLKIEDRKSVV